MADVSPVLRGAILLALAGLFCSGWLTNRWSKSLTVVVVRSRLAGWWASVGRLLARTGHQVEVTEPARAVRPSHQPTVRRPRTVS